MHVIHRRPILPMGKPKFQGLHSPYDRSLWSGMPCSEVMLCANKTTALAAQACGMLDWGPAL